MALTLKVIRDQCSGSRVRVAAVLPAVKRASVYTTDQRVHDCTADIEKWLAGDDTVDLQAAARSASEAASEAASRTEAWAAEAAVWAAVCAAAGAAAERKQQRG